jgi:hypothetical protein
MAALLAGGLGISLGSALAARSARGQARLARTSGWAVALFALVSVAVGATAAYAAIRPVLDSAGGTAPVLGSPLRLFVLGVLLGLPLSLPGVVMAWRDARAEERKRSKRRDHVPTKDDRRAYAEGLARQIRDASDRPRELTVSVVEDGGRVLLLDGDIDPREGERLTAALRGELQDLGFKRVKGGRAPRTWWSRV